MQLNNKIKLISIVPLFFLFIISLYISYISYDSSVSDITKQPILFYASLVLLFLVLVLVTIGHFAGKELTTNAVNF